ncbi:tyrosine-type recombinase/integrase [Echinicola sp. 20G]|uniref:tyrosine-type recombinase/integrase n=1 Tax=Echinicola sp. 20G TaxID=2781961 RepID=UPI001910D1AE|nr:tyrosine-type recombinase/integrase [Echinicola sp. 20G]
MTIRPYLQNISKKTGLGTVYYILDFLNPSTRETVQFKTTVKIEKKHWKKNKVSTSHPSHYELNDSLNTELQEIHKILNELRIRSIPINATNVKNYRQVEKEGEKDFISLAKEYIALRTDAKPRMIEKLVNLVTRLEDFSGGKKFYYSQITQKWINDFTLYLQQERPDHPNKNLRKSQQPSTIHKTFSFLRQILNHYNKLDIIDAKYKNLNYPRAFKQKQMVLLEDEIRTLLEFQPPRESLQRVKDLAMVQLFTGLRYSDAVKINKTNVFNGQLSITAVKTNQNIHIPLHPALKTLLEKYDYDLTPLMISNQKYNDHLKTLIQMSGIDSKAEHIYFENGKQVTTQRFKYELVGSHTFRRTFITNAIIKGIPLHVIQSITGHTTLKQLSEYVNIADAIKEQEMNKLNGLFSVG